MKHLAFQIEKTHRRERPQQLVAQVRRKGTITKGKKTGKRSENTAIRRIQLVGQIAAHQIVIALKYTLSKIVQREELDQVNRS